MAGGTLESEFAATGLGNGGVCAPPATPTPLEDIAQALHGVDALNGLTEEEYRWFATHSAEWVGTDGAVVFREDEPAEYMTIILRGGVSVHRRKTGTVMYFIGRTPKLTGKLPFSRMKVWGGGGCAAGDLWFLTVHESLFPEMLAAIPSMGQRSVSILLDRTRDFARADQQAEKLDALGKLAANLSHELNNPASAGERAARRLEQKSGDDEAAMRLARIFDSDEQLAAYLVWRRRAFAAPAAVDDEALADRDREDHILTWLSSRAIPSAWSLAPVFAEAGLSTALLDELPGTVPAAALAPALANLAASLESRRMVDTICESSSRIFKIIRAMQQYTNMDQAAVQEIDLPASLDNTLTVLGPRLDRIEIILDYDRTAPPVTGFGGELSQVWTALIENSLDAMRGNGVLRLTTGREGEAALVEVWDNGPGIPAAITSRIFEPFFTTKPLGQGLGLGLDTVRRIVNKHLGSVTMHSGPGSTAFRVRLPRHRPL